MDRFFPRPAAILGVPDKVYQDVDRHVATRWIRLLRLHPAVLDERIDCTTFIVKFPNDSNLTDPEQYFTNSEPFEALSYVWGDASSPAEIVLDGRPTLIPNNLYHALKALRCPHRDRVLWADAICIRQDNAHEKSQQIPLIGSIFRAASKVLVWLGPKSTRNGDAIVHASEASDTGLNIGTEFFRSFLRTEQMPDSSNPEDDRIRRAKRFRARVEDRVPSDLVDLATRSYWQRGWVVQEFIVSRCYDILWADKRLAGEDFERIFNEYILLSRSTPGSFAHARDSRDFFENRELRQSRLAMLVYLRRRHIEQHKGDSEPNGPGTRMFWDTLSVLVHAKCLDIRDRVYSLIGFLPPAIRMSGMDVSYTKSTLDLFWDVIALVPVTDMIGNARTLQKALGLSWTTLIDSRAAVGEHRTRVRSVRIVFGRSRFAVEDCAYSIEGTTIMTGLDMHFEPCNYYDQAELAFEACGAISPSKRFQQTLRITSFAVVSRTRDIILSNADGTVYLVAKTIHRGREVVAIGSRGYYEGAKPLDEWVTERHRELSNEMFEHSFLRSLSIKFDHEARHAVLDVSPEQFMLICMQH